MSEEKFYYGAIDFWEENKELDSLHLLNKFIEEKYLPKLDIIKEVREVIDNITLEKLDDFEKYKMTPLKETWIGESILEILDKENK